MLRFSDADKENLNSSLCTKQGADAFRKFMFGKSHTTDGLAERLTAITKEAEKVLMFELGPAGIYVDFST